MSQLRDALEKSGVLYEQVKAVKEKEAFEKLEAEKAEKQKQLEIAKKLQMQNIERLEFSQFCTLIKPYNDPMDKKKRNFLFHLICSHIPSRVSHPLSIAFKKKQECCLCHKKVLTIEEIMDVVGSSSILLEMIRIDLQDVSPDEKSSAIKTRLNELFIGKTLGYTSLKTSTVLCRDCMKYFHQWIQNQIICGDRLVNSAIRSVMVKHAKGEE